MGNRARHTCAIWWKFAPRRIACRIILIKQWYPSFRKCFLLCFSTLACQLYLKRADRKCCRVAASWILAIFVVLQLTLIFVSTWGFWSCQTLSIICSTPPPVHYHSINPYKHSPSLGIFPFGLCCNNAASCWGWILILVGFWAVKVESCCWRRDIWGSPCGCYWIIWGGLLQEVIVCLGIKPPYFLCFIICWFRWLSFIFCKVGRAPNSLLIMLITLAYKGAVWALTRVINY